MAVEYAVMLALIVVVCIAAITTLGQNANCTFSFVGSSIERPGKQATKQPISKGLFRCGSQR